MLGRSESEYRRSCVLAELGSARAAWEALYSEQRLALIALCCRGCGDLDTSCRCWDDE